MISVAVKCKNNRDTAEKFLKIVNYMRDNHIYMNRLIYHQLIVGNNDCRIRFYSCDDFDISEVTKVDFAYGFSVKEQHEILKEGAKITRKFADFKADYTEELIKYFG